MMATMLVLFALESFANDEGHKLPDRLPPIGPHGGKYTKLTVHFAEVVVKNNKATVYILERDIKHIAEDASKVSVRLEIPRKGKQTLKLKQNKKTSGYETTISIPRRTRRAYFHIRCMLDNKWEKGKLLYEP